MAEPPKKIDDITLEEAMPSAVKDDTVKSPSPTQYTYRGNEGFGVYTSNSDYIKGDAHFNDLTDFKLLGLDNNIDKQESNDLITDSPESSVVLDDVIASTTPEPDPEPDPEPEPDPQGLTLDSIDNLSVLISGGDGNDTLIASTDGTWVGGWSAWNVETGQIIPIAGRIQSHDVFHGGAGYDTIELTSGDDAFFLDNQFSPFYDSNVQTRLLDVEEIRGNAGDDIIDLTSNNYTIGDIVLKGGDGDDYLWANDGNDTLDGEAGSDSIYGGAGDDSLIFDAIDISLDGGGDEDTLVFSDGDVDLTTLMTDIDNIEIFELHNTDLTVDKSSIDAASDIGNEITINGDVGSSVTLSGSWVAGASANGYTEYTDLDTTLNISDNITLI